MDADDRALLKRAAADADDDGDDKLAAVIRAFLRTGGHDTQP